MANFPTSQHYYERYNQLTIQSIAKIRKKLKKLTALEEVAVV